MSEVPGLDVQVQGAVLRLTLDRAGSGNAITDDMVVAICDALDAAEQSSDIRVIAICGTGANFCTGADLKQANADDGARPRTGHLQRRMAGGFHRMIRTLHELQLPVVVGVRGHASGAGLMLALSADYIVLAEDAVLSVPFVGRGFTPDSGSTYLLPRLVGINRAKEMILLARPVDAERAVAWGLANEVCSGARFETRFADAVDEFTVGPTVAVGLAKNLVNRNLDEDLSGALANEAFTEEIAVRTKDFKEGIASFMERRPTRYSGH